MCNNTSLCSECVGKLHQKKIVPLFPEEFFLCLCLKLFISHSLVCKKKKTASWSTMLKYSGLLFHLVRYIGSIGWMNG